MGPWKPGFSTGRWISNTEEDSKISKEVQKEKQMKKEWFTFVFQ